MPSKTGLNDLNKKIHKYFRTHNNLVKFSAPIESRQETTHAIDSSLYTEKTADSWKGNNSWILLETFQDQPN